MDSSVAPLPPKKNSIQFNLLTPKIKSLAQKKGKK